MKFVVIDVNEGLKVKEEKEISLKHLQEEVKGKIQSLSFYKEDKYNGFTFYANEEGIILYLKENKYAKKFLRGSIVGNIVISKTDEDGETIGLNDKDIAFLKK